MDCYLTPFQPPFPFFFSSVVFLKYMSALLLETLRKAELEQVIFFISKDQIKHELLSDIYLF